MNRDTLQEASHLLVQATQANDAVGQTVFAQRRVLGLVIRVLVIVLGELALIGCSGGVFRSYNIESDAGDPWSSDSSVSESITNDAGAAGSSSLSLGGNTSTDAIASSYASSGGSTSTGSSASGGTSQVATGGTTASATGGASQYHDPGECPCPQNNACQVSASGCNVPGTKGNEGNETFTCVVSPLHCSTATRPVFCFQC
jgi:hypothetical protein